jgi:hypothetical protein
MSIIDHDQPLLVSRARACEMLGGISRSHIQRLMDAGDLRPVDLNPSPRRCRRGKLYFRLTDIEALVERYANRTPPTLPETRS